MWKRIWKEWYYDFSSQNNILNHENQKLKGYNQELEGDLKHIIDMENEENYQYIHISFSVMRIGISDIPSLVSSWPNHRVSELPFCLLLQHY